MTGPYPPQPPPYYGPPVPAPAKSNRGLVIALVSIVGVLALACVAGIVGVVWYVQQRDGSTPGGSTDAAIEGLIDYRTTHPEWLKQDHKPPTEKIEYPMTPGAGGPHHGVWQRCAGDVYPTPVDEGNAVHSLEHGAVWITYQPGTTATEVEQLAGKVRNKDYLLMSPYDGQPSRISLQAWGYQLRLESAGDPRVDAFIKRFRQTASMEPGVPCSTGSTSTDLSPAPTPS